MALSRRLSSTRIGCFIARGKTSPPGTGPSGTSSPTLIRPDTITRRFKKLARQADLQEIDLRDVRHSHATAGRKLKIEWKALSKRIGHADVTFTMKQYAQTDLEADREVANLLADLIIGGLLVTEVDDQADAFNQAEET